jgi:hypothetical protein
LDLGKVLGEVVGGADPVGQASSLADAANHFLGYFKLSKDVQAQVQAQVTADNIDLEKAKLASALAQVQGQLAINQQEAASTNWFVAGWRPGVGWVCVAGLAYDLILAPFAQFLLATFHWAPKGIALPVLDSASITALLIPLLGIGALRTAEKIQNAEGNR